MKAKTLLKLDLPQEALKLLAAVTMFIDHLGLTQFPEALWLRCIGRLAFPIYAFFLAEGFCRTGSQWRYLLRLLLFALVSELPFDRMVRGVWFTPKFQNVLWTLALGLLALWGLALARKTDGWKGLIGLLAVPGCCILADFTNTDYGAFGVLLCVLFYVTRSVCFRAVVRSVVFVVMCYGFYGSPDTLLPLEVYGVISIPLLELYRGRKLSQNVVAKYGFYAFYPVHMWILSLI